jgi:hypothetical protein
MPLKSFTIEQIIGKLREAEVFLSRGQAIGDICRSFNISEQTNLFPLAEGIRWDPHRPSAPVEGTGEREYPVDIVPMSFGKKLVTDLLLDNSILRETVRGNLGLKPGQTD